jgi:hypothetical protein
MIKIGGTRINGSGDGAAAIERFSPCKEDSDTQSDIPQMGVALSPTLPPLELLSKASAAEICAEHRLK